MKGSPGYFDSNMARAETTWSFSSVGNSRGRKRRAESCTQVALPFVTIQVSAMDMDVCSTDSAVFSSSSSSFRVQEDMLIAELQRRVSSQSKMRSVSSHAMGSMSGTPSSAVSAQSTRRPDLGDAASAGASGVSDLGPGCEHASSVAPSEPSSSRLMAQASNSTPQSDSVVVDVASPTSSSAILSARGISSSTIGSVATICTMAQRRGASRALLSV
mmetsp:Transcript_53666/g.150813  ORF Transcript_53666/g.150813 Transcript_53666/m.150813 type:complete len:216 (+) Transcript_53666:384-1031(+)